MQNFEIGMVDAGSSVGFCITSDPVDTEIVRKLRFFLVNYGTIFH